MFHLIVVIFTITGVAFTALAALAMGSEAFERGVERSHTQATVHESGEAGWQTTGSFR